MTLQKRLRRVMRRKEWRTADLARYFDVPYTTAREWVLSGRIPMIDRRSQVDRLLSRLEEN